MHGLHVQDNDVVGGCFHLFVCKRRTDPTFNPISFLPSSLSLLRRGFPLFLLSVVDNHGHAFPVGMFMVGSENAELIAEALRFFKAWNPEWDPKVG